MKTHTDGKLFNLDPCSNVVLDLSTVCEYEPWILRDTSVNNSTEKVISRELYATLGATCQLVLVYVWRGRALFLYPVAELLRVNISL